MSSGANGEWVRQGTPRDDNADWNEEQSEYGTAITPTEWDDYSNEQSVPVTPPRAQSEDGDTPDSPTPADPVPGQEPDAGDDYRSDEVDPLTVDDPVGDADDDGMEPARLEDTESSLNDENGIGHEPSTQDEETTRPRPIVPEPSQRAAGASAVTGDEVSQATADAPTEAEPQTDEHHLDAADYLAVDPEPAPATDSVPVPEDRDDEPTQHVDTGDVDDEPTEYVEATELDDEPTRHLDSDDELTQHVDTDDMEATQAVPVAAAAGVGAASAAGVGTAPDGLYRAEGTEETTVLAQDEYPRDDADVEEERQLAQLEAERQAREQRLGVVPTSPDNASRVDAGPRRITTDRFLPSLALFVMRIVLAGVLGLASFQILASGVDATANFLGGYPLIPEPRLVAWILGFTLGAMALLLVIGLLQRLVGFLLLVISVATLVLVRWGNFPIFSSGGLWVDGFIGDKDLLLAVIGLVLLGLGGGAWGIDGAFRRARAASKAERQG